MSGGRRIAGVLAGVMGIFPLADSAHAVPHCHESRTAIVGQAPEPTGVVTIDGINVTISPSAAVAFATAMADHLNATVPAYVACETEGTDEFVDAIEQAAVCVEEVGLSIVNSLRPADLYFRYFWVESNGNVHFEGGLLLDDIEAARRCSIQVS